MDIITLVISIVALAAAVLAYMKAANSRKVLAGRIEKLRSTNNSLEAKLRKLEGSVGRKNQPRQEQRQPEQPQKQREDQKPRKKKENKRRNEPAGERESTREQKQAMAAPAVNLEFADGDLLAELERSANATPPPVQPEAMPEAAPESGIRFSIIPEDGVIRQNLLQQRPDSDSYIEMDVPADGSTKTRYRFNLSGNHAFVIAQGIDRLENAFDFEKPSNRMVSKVVQQHDGTLTKVNNGWKIHEKARIDFR